MALSLGLHIIGFALWAVGLLLLPRIMAGLSKLGTPEPGSASVVKRLWWGWVIPGCLIAIATGLHQLMSGGVAAYMAQGWFHTKLTLVLLLVVLTILAWSQVKRFSNGESTSKGKLMFIHGGTAFIFIVTVLLMKAGR